MGRAAANAQTSLGSCREELGAEGLPQVPPGTWAWESSQVCTKPGSLQSCSLPVLLSPFFFLSSQYHFPSSELSPPGFPLLTFSLPSPSPSFLLHRTRRVSFIYLFITPAINTLLGLPSFSMWVGGEKGRKCWLEGGWNRTSGWEILPRNKRLGQSWEKESDLFRQNPAIWWGTNSARISSSPLLYGLMGMSARTVVGGWVGSGEVVLQRTVLPWILYTAPSPDARSPIQRNPATSPNSNADKKKL